MTIVRSQDKRDRRPHCRRSLRESSATFAERKATLARWVLPHRFLASLLFILSPAICCSTLSAQIGVISGKASPADDLKAVAAVDRTSGKQFVGKIGRDGRFRIEQLPLNATYDGIVDYGSARLEGVNLRVPASEYEEEQPLTDDDRAKIKQEIAALNKFEDKVEVLAIEGNIQHAAVLVHKLRTRSFVNSKPGEVVWRVELWHFERPDETWLKVQDELFLTLYRERLQRAEFEKKAVTFTPALGDISLSAASPAVDLGAVHLPPATQGVRFIDVDPLAQETQTVKP